MLYRFLFLSMCSSVNFYFVLNYNYVCEQNHVKSMGCFLKESVCERGVKCQFATVVCVCLSVRERDILKTTTVNKHSQLHSQLCARKLMFNSILTIKGTHTMGYTNKGIENHLSLYLKH